MIRRLNIVRLSHYLIIMVILVYFLVSAKFILQPIFFAVFFMFILKPLTSFFQKYLKNSIISILLSFITVLIPITGIVWVFSIQAIDIFKNLPSLGNKLVNSITSMVDWVTVRIPYETPNFTEAINDNIKTIVDTSMSLVSTGVNSSTSILTSFLLSLLFTFFFLYYRTAIKEFLISQSPRKSQSKTRKTLSEIQKVIMSYCYGMLIVIGILAVLNSVGLYIIGIKYSIFWGVLAAFLAIIPFVGTTLGGLLPFVYAIATADSMWQPVAVVILYVIIQQLEGNIITPNVVGNSISINPLVAIMAMLVGGTLWGLAGLVLALPLAAILKLLFDKVDPLRPLSLLMESNLANKADTFRTDLNEERFRISTLIKNDRLISSKKKNYFEEEE